MMWQHNEITQQKLHALIHNGEVQWGGNRNLKIYGLLNCTSGKRMKTANRVFFASEAEAQQAGYRPCGHCMKTAYLDWKQKEQRL